MKRTDEIRIRQWYFRDPRTLEFMLDPDDLGIEEDRKCFTIGEYEKYMNLLQGAQ